MRRIYLSIKKYTPCMLSYVSSMVLKGAQLFLYMSKFSDHLVKECFKEKEIKIRNASNS